MVCAFTYFNDHIIRRTFFISNHMPAAVYGGLILTVLLLLNPLLRRIFHESGVFT